MKTTTFRRLSVVLLSAVVPLTLLPAAASAQSGGWNYYDTTLPEFVTGPTPFEVVVNGDAPVCSMQYGEQTDAAAPWQFTFDPTSPTWNDQIDITLCDGELDAVTPYSRLPFDIDGTIMAYGSVPSVRNRTDEPASVLVTNPKGDVVFSGTVPGSDTLDIAIPNAKQNTTVAYTISVTGLNGMNVTTTAFRPKGWTPLMSRDSAPFAPCSTLKWSYQPSGSGPGKKTMRTDIVNSLKRLAPLTGLKFVYTEDPANADLSYGWENMGAGGPAGTGGYSYSSDTGSVGKVTFNSKHYWTKDKHAGFASGKRANGYGPAGRGWLVIHETMHALGLGHVDNEKSIMAPINRGQAKFTRGDIEGLQSLYPSAGCAAS